MSPSCVNIAANNANVFVSCIEQAKKLAILFTKVVILNEFILSPMILYLYNLEKLSKRKNESNILLSFFFF